MIAVDTSALFAILAAEPDATHLSASIAEAERVLVGAPTLFEFRLVATRKGGNVAEEVVDRILEDLTIEIVPWTAEHVRVATDALLRFGGRPARLNYGDCMAYAVAKVAGYPLLFKGDDFTHTDVRSAL